MSDSVRRFLAAAEVVAQLLSDPAVGDAWLRPSALVDWTVGGLAGHLARGVFTVESALASEVDERQPALDAVEYYAVVPDEDLHPGSPVAGTIRMRGVESAGPGSADLIARYERSLQELGQALPAMDADRKVTTFGRVLPLGECLRTRTLELVVHADDLTVSCDLEPLTFPADVTEDVIGMLAAIATRRRGTVAVIRGLARPERAPTRIAAF